MAVRPTALTVGAESCLPHSQWQGVGGWPGRCRPDACEAAVLAGFNGVQHPHDRKASFNGADDAGGAASDDDAGHRQGRCPASVATIR